MIKVILCDDHAVVRRGIRDTISEAIDIQVVGEAGSYPELREAMRKTECDVLVLDLNMPGRGGLEVLAALKEEGSTVKTLVVSMYPEDQYAIRCLRAGARGYLNKAGEPAELVAAIRTVMQGRKYVTAEVAQMLVDNLQRARERRAARQPVRARAADPAEDRLGQEALGHRRRTHAQPQDGQRLPRPRAGKAAPGEQRRTHGVRDSQRDCVAPPCAGLGTPPCAADAASPLSGAFGLEGGRQLGPAEPDPGCP